MRALAREVYYTSSTFLIRRRFSRLSKFRYPPYGSGHFIRRLQVQIYIDLLHGFDSKIIRLAQGGLGRLGNREAHWGDLHYLIRPLAKETSHHTSWQAEFPKLELFTVALAVQSCLGRETGTRIAGLPQQATIDIRPKRVEFKYRHIGCRWGGECQAPIVDTLRSMVKLRVGD